MDQSDFENPGFCNSCQKTFKGSVGLRIHRAKVHQSNQGSSELVLGNALVVKMICSFTESKKDLLNFRCINRLFYQEATKQLRTQITVNLLQEDQIKSFTSCIQSRFEPNINPLPFQNVKLGVLVPFKTLKVFITAAGEHLRKLYLICFDGTQDRRKLLDLEHKLVFILSNTPNLEKFSVTSERPARLNPANIAALPVSFPQLRHLSITHTSHDAASSSPDSVSLLSALITRPRVLDCVHLPQIRETSDQGETLSALDLILQHHHLNLPVMSIDECKILPSTLPSLQRLTEMGFTFKKFPVDLSCLCISFNDLHGEQIQNLRNCVSWVGAQSATLTSLRIRLYHEPFAQFRIPTLVKLTKLKLSCFLVSLENCPLLPLPPNQLPVLEELILEDYNDGFRIFEHCHLPSVRKLCIKYQRGLMTAPWHRIFPNVTTLHFRVSSPIQAGGDRPNLEFLLKHFTWIEHLDLKLKSDCWNILTGSSPRPTTTHALLHKALEGRRREREEPIDGVFQTASLRNLRALKTLRCSPVERGNLDAILYMTRAGHLAPLRYISLIKMRGEEFKMKFKEVSAYYTQLTQVHSNVTFDLKLGSRESVEFNKLVLSHESRSRVS